MHMILLVSGTAAQATAMTAASQGSVAPKETVVTRETLVFRV
jgi:hypothetical protein